MRLDTIGEAIVTLSNCVELILTDVRYDAFDEMAARVSSPGEAKWASLANRDWSEIIRFPITECMGLEFRDNVAVARREERLQS